MTVLSPGQESPSPLPNSQLDESEKQTEKQTERQTEKQTERQTDGQI